MPGSLSDYAEKLSLDFILSGGAVTRPTSWFLALFTAAPTDAGGGTEVSGNGYARQAITHAATTLGTGKAASSNAPSFTAAGGNFGSVVATGIFDAATGGNLLYFATLDAAQTVNDGNTLSFPAGNVSITLD